MAKCLGESKRISKKLSWILRHGAERRGFKLQPGGFLYIDELLTAEFPGASERDIIEVVENNDKQRFAVQSDENTGRLKIRANQGHTLQVENLELTEIIDASMFPVVVHGTMHRFVNSIIKKGLSKMNRNHIHFAAGEPGANGVISGMRNTCDVVIYIKLQKAIEAGIQFFVSSNKVILSPGNDDGFLPTEFFDKILDRYSGERIHLSKSTQPTLDTVENRSKKSKQLSKHQQARNQNECSSQNLMTDFSSLSSDIENTSLQEFSATSAASIVTADDIADELEFKKHNRKKT